MWKSGNVKKVDL
jgi:hypothetical protein